jgi:NAD(P)H-flavin reductase
MNLGQLKNLLGTKTQRNDVELYVDGPFSSPFSDVINSKTAICIAGGIGFTPFLCVIHHLMYNRTMPATKLNPPAF